MRREPYWLRASPPNIEEAKRALSAWGLPVPPGQICLTGSGAFGLVGNDVDLMVSESGLLAALDQAGTPPQLEVWHTPAGGEWAGSLVHGRCAAVVFPDASFEAIRASYHRAVWEHHQTFRRLKAEGLMDKASIYTAVGVVLTATTTAQFARLGR